jgi:hypothetical protein
MVKGRNHKITMKAMENRRDRKRSSRPESPRSLPLTEERNAERALESFFLYSSNVSAPTDIFSKAWDPSIGVYLTRMSYGDGWGSNGRFFFQ